MRGALLRVIPFVTARFRSALRPLWWNRQSKTGRFSGPGTFHSPGSLGLGKLGGFQVLQPIDFCDRPPCLLGISTSLLKDIFRVIPALEMTAAELSFWIFFIAGALPWLFDFYFVMRELFGGDAGFGCGQSLSSYAGADRRVK